MFGGTIPTSITPIITLAGSGDNSRFWGGVKVAAAGRVKVAAAGGVGVGVEDMLNELGVCVASA